VEILVAIFHGFDRFAVSGELVAMELKKFGAGIGFTATRRALTKSRRYRFVDCMAFALCPVFCRTIFFGEDNDAAQRDLCFLL
jgi:hypothetical protein